MVHLPRGSPRKGGVLRTLKLRLVEGQASGPDADPHAKIPERGTAPSTPLREVDFNCLHSEHIKCVNECARLLPDSPPSHLCYSDTSARGHEKRERILRMEMEKKFGKQPGECLFKNVHSFLDDLHEQPQEVEFCRFPLGSQRKAWKVMEPAWQRTGDAYPGTPAMKATMEEETETPPSGAHSMSSGGLVDVTLAGRQVWVCPGEGPEFTIVTARLWMNYVRQAREKNLSTTDYDEYRRMTRMDRIQMRRNIMIKGGTSIHTHGPFQCWIRLKSSSVKMPVYVTADGNMTEPFMPGRDLWQTMPVMMVCRKGLQNEAQAWVAKEGKRYKALLNTGSEFNLISHAAFLRMGYEETDVQEAHEMMTQDSMEVLQPLGVAMIETEIIHQRVSMRCFIVKELKEVDLILGREFMREHDVNVDLSRQRMALSNAQGRYQVREILKERTPAHQLRASVKEDVEIKPGGVHMVSCDVFPRKKGLKGRKVHRGGTWLAMVEGEKGNFLQNRGIAAPRALVMVREGQVVLPFLSIRGKEGRSSHIPAGTANLIVRPVNQEYERETRPSLKQEVSSKIYMLDEGKDDSWSETTPENEVDDLATITSLHVSELPIILPEEDHTEFSRLPAIEHLRDELEPEQLQTLQDLLEQHQAMFSINKADIGEVRGVEHDIELMPKAVPFKDQYRRFIPEKKEAVTEQVRELLEQDMIEESQSPYSSAVVLIKRGDGTWRFCVDFRRLNTITQSEDYPLPPMKETMEYLQETKYFTTLSLPGAFWQVKLSDRSKELTAFVTSEGQFQWKKMPFGLSNGAATFQRLMARALADVSLEYGNLALCFMEDVLIATRTVEQHLQRLNQVLSAIGATGIKLKADKCHVMREDIRIMGRRISKDGIQPDPDRVKP